MLRRIKKVPLNFCPTDNTVFPVSLNATLHVGPSGYWQIIRIDLSYCSVLDLVLGSLLSLSVISRVTDSLLFFNHRAFPNIDWFCKTFSCTIIFINICKRWITLSMIINFSLKELCKNFLLVQQNAKHCSL